MYKYAVYFFSLIFFGISCTDSSTIGLDLLEDEQLNIGFNDSINIEASTILAKPRYAYAKGQNVFSHLVGKVDDPIFGKIETTIYTRFSYSALPSFEDITVDSAVLILAYDSLSYYGNTQATHKLEVYEIEDDFLKGDTVLADKSFNVKPLLLGSASFIMNRKDSIKLVKYSDSTNIKVPAQIRIRIDSNWIRDLVKNPIFIQAASNGIDSILYKTFRGLQIVNKTTDNALLGLNFSGAGVDQNNRNTLVIYYRSKTNKKNWFNFSLNGTKMTTGVPDYTTAIFGQKFNDETFGGELVYLQSLGGTAIKLRLTDIDRLRGKIINYALLDITLAELPGDNLSLYPPIKQILTLSEDSTNNNRWLPIFDLERALTFGFPNFEAYGGTLSKDKKKNTMVYRMNITNWLKQRLDNPSLSRELILSADLFEGLRNINEPLIDNERANRSILYGPKSTTSPMKLRVTYTDN
jgi:hypothetical protein